MRDPYTEEEWYESDLYNAVMHLKGIKNVAPKYFTKEVKQIIELIEKLRLKAEGKL